MAKNYSMKTERAKFELAGKRARLIRVVTRKTVERNQPLIGLYLVITAGSIVASYFTSTWWSVGVSLAVAVATFFIGLGMIREVITITNEIR